MSNLFYNTVLRQKKELKQILRGNNVERTQLPMLQKALKSPLIKVVTGPRRAGKSTLALEALSRHNFAYLNFEDEGIPGDLSGDEIMETLEKIYGKSHFIFFDEIQNWDRWQQFVHRLHRTHHNCIITGSNSKLLSDELSSSLTGRHIRIELLPFGFLEISQGLGKSSQKDFDIFLKEGGFPEVVLGRTDYATYLRTLWDAVVLKDIVQRKKIREVALLNDVLALALSSTTSKMTYDALKRGLVKNISAPTVKNFLLYAEEAYLIFQLQKFELSARKRIKSERKIYTIDNGFFSAKKVSLSEDRGRLLENLVFQELIRRGFRSNLDLFYYQNEDAQEVDFLMRESDLSVSLMQVCYDMSNVQTRDREIRALKKAAKELSPKRMEILTYDYQDEIATEGMKVSVTPIMEWLKNNVAS